MTSKLGFHIIEPYRRKNYDQAIVNSKAGVKVVGSPSELGILDYYHKQNPSALYIARVFPYEKTISDMKATGKSAELCAATMLQLLSGFVSGSGMGWCYFECGLNEPGDGDIEWTNKYYQYLVPRLRASGVKSVSYNFSVCHPPLAYWKKLSSSLAEIKKLGRDWALVGLHQYGLFGNMQDYAEAGDGARVLRHRVVPELRGVPIVITECGLDEPGWQKTDQGVDGYLADLKWLDYEIKRDENVLWAYIYTADGAPGWEPFRVEGDLATRLFDYITISNASIVEVPPPPPSETVDNGLGTIVMRYPQNGWVNVRDGRNADAPIVGRFLPSDSAELGECDTAIVGRNGEWIFIDGTTSNPCLRGWSAAWLYKTK